MSRIMSLVSAVTAAAVLAIAHPAPAVAHGNPCFVATPQRTSTAFDGLYGYYTRSQVMAFQRDRGLVVDGIVGPKTRAALEIGSGTTLHLGHCGKEVEAVQKRLAELGFWAGATAPEPSPEARVTPMPLPEETPEPVYTPQPSYTPEPETEPTPAPEATEMGAAPHECPPNTPTLEVAGTAFWVPTQNLFQTGFSALAVAPAYSGEASLWAGDWGVGGAYAAYPQFPVAGYGPWSAGAATMVDGLVKYRWDKGYYNVFGGYRGLYAGGVSNHFGTLGVGMDRPLVCDWLWLTGDLSAAYGNTAMWLVDGQLGLEARFSPLSVGLSYREMAFKESNASWGWFNGPVAEVKLQF